MAGLLETRPKTMAEQLDIVALPLSRRQETRRTGISTALGEVVREGDATRRARLVARQQRILRDAIDDVSLRQQANLVGELKIAAAAAEDFGQLEHFVRGVVTADR